MKTLSLKIIMTVNNDYDVCQIEYVLPNKNEVISGRLQNDLCRPKQEISSFSICFIVYS